jgi:hypothetical protein
LEEFDNVATGQHVLGIHVELTVSSAGVILQTVLTTRPVRYQDHHPSAFLGKNRMPDQFRNTSNVILHSVNKLVDVLTSDGFTNEHVGVAIHKLFSFGFGMLLIERPDTELARRSLLRRGFTRSRSEETI